MMHGPDDEVIQFLMQQNRRTFLSKLSVGIGSLALGSLMCRSRAGLEELAGGASVSSFQSIAPKAKRVIYLFQSGAPSQLELFDYKPLLNKMRGQDLPESIRQGQRLTTMTSGQKRFPLVGSSFAFGQHGESGAHFSELLPHMSGIADEITLIKSMYTEAINHDPAVTFLQCGHQQPGRPAMGSWLSYGLGSENENLPAFCVFLSRGKGNIQPLASRMWGSAFLPSIHQGVQLRSGKDPVLYLENPDGFDSGSRREMLDKLAALNQKQMEEMGDPEISTRIAQYEMAYRMQTSVPEVLNLADEPTHILNLYGPDVLRPGSYAANCLMARRLSESGVRFVQLYHMGWDAHSDLPETERNLTRDVDQPSAALIKDLKQRGLLDETLVIWGGEFGRTNYCQGDLTRENYGRDHHPRCFTIWMAGGGIKKGYTHGETDEFGYNIIRDPVHVHDFQATLLHLLGIDHEKMTFKYQGRRFRLTDVAGKVVDQVLA